MEPDRLFIHTLHDLEQRTTATDEYTILMSTALLRKLLLDRNRLVDLANRNRRLDLRFRISDVSPYEQMILNANPTFWSIEDALYPDLPIAYAPYNATRDQFLKRNVMLMNGHLIAVRDVIDHLANVEGAVHSGPARHERHRTLQAAAKFYSCRGLPGVVNQVRLIARITVRGLIPLRDAIYATGTATWASVNSAGSVELSEDS